MQLSKKTGLGAALASATCGLLGSLPAQSVVAAEVTAADDKSWTFDSALLYYGENDSRVKDASLKSIIAKVLDDRRSMQFSLSVDSLTGASPTGAVPTDSVQTFTRPSGAGNYQIAPGALPLDDTFHDTRYAATGSWLQSVGDSSRVQLGLSFSTEFDYQHIGADVRYERDFNQRNTTLFVGAAYGNETIDPEGGTPVPFAFMQGLGSSLGKLGSDSKQVSDALIGVTQILSRRSLLSVTYSYSLQDGYLNDPFKVLSVVDGTTGRPVAGPVGSGIRAYRFESRPDSRSKQSLYGEWRYAFDRDSMALSLRYMTDDWGVDSSTLEARYRINASDRYYFEPVLRYYTQSKADFYRSYLVNGQALPEHASADYRLAEMNAVTAGLKFGYRGRSGEYSMRVEYYKQTTSSDDPKIGVLANYDLVPPLTAVIAQFGYKFKL